MPVRVWLPPLLRDRDDAEEIVGEGDTLRDVLLGLGGAGVRAMNTEAAEAEAGRLQVFLNGAPTEDWLAAVGEGDQVMLLPPIRGGR